MAAHFLAISTRQEDVDFGRRVSAEYGLQFHSAESSSQVSEVLSDYPQTLVFWDVDHPKADDPRDPMSAEGIGRVLMKVTTPERVVAVSSKPLKDTPHLFKAPAFNHYIFRRYDDPAFKIYSRIGMACLMPDPFGLARYVPEGTKIQQIQLKKASHRAPAVEALKQIFSKSKGHPRLMNMMSQTCDELLMNAIFSAPVDKTGKRYRAAIPRTEDFDLNEKEMVTLELAITEDSFAVLVRDQFGSLDKNVILPYIQTDYEKKSYRPQGGASAGLGLYTILQSGQSLIFISKPKFRTEVALIFPLSRTPREFKEAFRFFSFILK